MWTNNWVPGILNGHPNPRVGVLEDKTQVVALIIDLASKSWRTNEIDVFFSENDGKVISMIHVGESHSPDRLI